MPHIIYWLISENFQETYIGFTDNINKRVKEHKNKKVKTTKNFGRLRCFKIEGVKNLQEAKKREKYWKSSAGRKKLRDYFKKINKMPPSSSG